MWFAEPEYLKTLFWVCNGFLHKQLKEIIRKILLFLLYFSLFINIFGLHHRNKASKHLGKVSFYSKAEQTFSKSSPCPVSGTCF